METKYHNINGLELPAYLGYGILNEQSITYENEKLSAEYVFECDGSIVHKVELTKERANLNTFCHGKIGFMSTYPTLKHALMYECIGWRLNKDEPYQFLAKQICRLGNIYVNHPVPDEKSTSVNFYPAGKMFIFSLPLIIKSEVYLNFIEKIKGSNLLKFYRERKGHFLFLNNDSKVTMQHIIVADFIVPLAHLYNAAKILISEKVIESEKHMRLMINESYNSEFSFMQTFLGNKHYKSFCVIFKEIPKEKYSALAEIFIYQARGLQPTSPA